MEIELAEFWLFEAFCAKIEINYFLLTTNNK
jgi:hypothetical protein